jgi:hypothetical protein
MDNTRTGRIQSMAVAQEAYDKLETRGTETEMEFASTIRRASWNGNQSVGSVHNLQKTGLSMLASGLVDGPLSVALATATLGAMAQTPEEAHTELAHEMLGQMLSANVGAPDADRAVASAAYSHEARSADEKTLQTVQKCALDAIRRGTGDRTESLKALGRDFNSESHLGVRNYIAVNDGIIKNFRAPQGSEIAQVKGQIAKERSRIQRDAVEYLSYEEVQTLGHEVESKILSLQRSILA